MFAHIWSLIDFTLCSLDSVTKRRWKFTQPLRKYILFVAESYQFKTTNESAAIKPSAESHIESTNGNDSIFRKKVSFYLFVSSVLELVVKTKITVT